MIKITHYEVYTDTGGGWQLEDRFSAEQRQEAFNLAKEREIEKLKVKIIKEIFDVQDNSYQESVEYVSNLNRGSSKIVGSGTIPALRKVDGEGNEKISVSERKANNTVIGALVKLIVLIILCLAFSNFLVSLLFPVLENFIPEDNSKPILFIIFFILFLGMAIPLVLKNIPWYVFAAGGTKVISREIPEKKFYDKAEDLVRTYSLNDNMDPIMTPAYPEAPLEYKQYMISFLAELLSNIQSHTTLSTSFSKLGVKLIVYGGCLEMARYSGLILSEANSILYEAFRITDGEEADLEAFYEAKRTYRDNRVAIFLTGVGAYLMSHVIEGRPMPTELLNITFKKWEKQNKGEPVAEPSPVEQFSADDISLDVIVSLKSDMRFLDDSIPNQDEIAAKTSAEIRNIVVNLSNKYNGSEIGEADGITKIKFKKLNYGIKFATECLKDIATYQEETNNESIILRNCCAIIDYEAAAPEMHTAFVVDMFEHVYNGEIVVTQAVEEALLPKEYHFDFLGEKMFTNLNSSVALYKLID